MSVNLLRVASLAATFGLSITAHAGEIIKDRSPDGRFALQLSADEDVFELELDEDAPPLIWAAQARLDEKEAADRGLSSFIADHPEQANPFYTEIDNFLLGKMSEKDLLAAADSGEKKKRPNNSAKPGTTPASNAC